MPIFFVEKCEKLLQCKSFSHFFNKKNISVFGFKGRFLLFQVYRNFANLFSELSVCTFDKEMSKFQQKNTGVKELD